jgi:hypothetical protein
LFFWCSYLLLLRKKGNVMWKADILTTDASWFVLMTAEVQAWHFLLHIVLDKVEAHPQIELEFSEKIWCVWQKVICSVICTTSTILKVITKCLKILQKVTYLSGNNFIKVSLRGKENINNNQMFYNQLWLTIMFFLIFSLSFYQDLSWPSVSSE